MPVKSATSRRHMSTATAQHNEIWPKLGPFPWLRTLEVALQASPKLDDEIKKVAAELIGFIRVELRERSATTEAEQAMLRMMRATSVADQKQLLKLLYEQGAGMPTPDAEAFVDNLNFDTLGTGGAR